jgi:hypothetical protein
MMALFKGYLSEDLGRQGVPRGQNFSKSFSSYFSSIFCIGNIKGEFFWVLAGGK